MKLRVKCQQCSKSRFFFFYFSRNCLYGKTLFFDREPLIGNFVFIWFWYWDGYNVIHFSFKGILPKPFLCGKKTALF